MVEGGNSFPEKKINKIDGIYPFSDKEFLGFPGLNDALTKLLLEGLQKNVYRRFKSPEVLENKSEFRPVPLTPADVILQQLTELAQDRLPDLITPEGTLSISYDTVVTELRDFVIDRAEVFGNLYLMDTTELKREVYVKALAAIGKKY